MIKIIAAGKLKHSAYAELTEEYIKRISRFTRVRLIETPDYDSGNDPGAVIREGEKILSEVEERDWVILCDIGGAMTDSVAFAEHLSFLLTSGKSSIAFIVGGSEGVSEDVRKRADEKVSFSRMTFPHNLFRVILTEQIYRAFKIINGERYHK